MRLALFALSLAFLLLTACQSEDESTTAEEARPAPVEATIDLEIGEAEGDGDYLFGNLAGITVDDEGRIVVVDWQAHIVRAYDPDGAFLYTVATHGEGPGEVDRPCCPAIGPDGHLWVRDDQNRRYQQFRLTEEGAAPGATVSMEHTMFGLRAATTFDADGHVIDVGSAPAEGTSRFVRTRYHRTADRETVREVMLPQAPAERLGMVQVDQNGGTARYSLPGGAQEYDAHAPNGDFAYMVSDRYQVVRFNADGDTLHVLSRTPEPIPRSDEETEEMQQTLQRLSEMSGVSAREMERKIPDDKLPVRTLFFDQQNRLWVQRTTAEDAPNEADVYTPDGRLEQVVQWPADVQLTLGHITEYTAYGVRSGADTFPQVVRLRY